MNRKLRNEELQRVSLEDFKTTAKTPLIVILDDVRSMFNVGSVFRTADAFCIEKIYLCGITAKPPHREIQKTALGATDSVEWEYAATALEVVEQLKGKGVKVLAIEQVENSILLNEFEPEKGVTYALIFGNEAKGVQQQVVDAADNCLEIPQWGTKHSLNIAVSAGVVLWDLTGKVR